MDMEALNYDPSTAEKFSELDKFLLDIKRPQVHENLDNCIAGIVEKAEENGCTRGVGIFEVSRENKFGLKFGIYTLKDVDNGWLIAADAFLFDSWWEYPILYSRGKRWVHMNEHKTYDKIFEAIVDDIKIQLSRES